MTVQQMQAQALTRAVSGQVLTNYPAIFEGFMARGIPEDQILPRENVFTYQAWRALGRQVRKGEHGVKVLTWVTANGKTAEAQDTDEEPRSAGFRFCRSTTVFHVSQTDPITDAQRRGYSDRITGHEADPPLQEKDREEYRAGYRRASQEVTS